MSFISNFNKMLQRSKGGIGQWCVIRHFSETRSEYWNEETQESVGGPPNLYTDTVVLGSKQIATSVTSPTKTAQENILQSVNISRDSFAYFFSPDTIITTDDEIFDLDASGQTQPTVIYSGSTSNIIGRFKVDFVNTYRVGNRGEKTYTVAVAKRYHAE